MNSFLKLNKALSKYNKLKSQSFKIVQCHFVVDQDQDFKDDAVSRCENTGKFFSKKTWKNSQFENYDKTLGKIFNIKLLGSNP